MQCRNCGAFLNETDEYCATCRTKVEPVQPANPVQNNQQPIVNNQPNVMEQPNNIPTQQPIINNQPNVIAQPNNTIPTQQPIVQNYNEGNNGQYVNPAPVIPQEEGNNLKNLIPLILGIITIVLLFLKPISGIIVGAIALLINKKSNNKNKKKYEILIIIATVLCIFATVTKVLKDFEGYNLSDEELKGTWTCLAPTKLSQISSGINSSVWAEATFGNGKYTIKTGGNLVNGEIVDAKTESGKYKMKASKINEDVWNSVKGDIANIWELEDKSPKPFMLETDDDKTITALKIYTKDSDDILMLYTGNDSYVCWNYNSESSPIKNDNSTSSEKEETPSTPTSSVKGQYTKEIFSGNSFENKKALMNGDDETFKFYSDSTFELIYPDGETYKGEFEVYDGSYINTKANQVALDSSITSGDTIAENIKTTAENMNNNSTIKGDVYLIWFKTDSGINRPYLIKYDSYSNTGISVDIIGTNQGTFTKK